MLVVVVARAGYVSIAGRSTHNATVFLLGLAGIFVAVAAAWDTFVVFLQLTRPALRFVIIGRENVIFDSMRSGSSPLTGISVSLSLDTMALPSDGRHDLAMSPRSRR